MNETSIDEQLSALADGELERGPARFLLRRLENEPQLAQRFARYQMVRSCLRRETLGADRGEFCAGVMARLEAEDAQSSAAPVAKAGSARVRWARRALGGMIAAGVAALALFAASPRPLGEPEADLTAAHRPAPGLGLALVAQPASVRISTPVIDSQIAGPLVDDYLVRHSGAVATHGSGNAVPFAYAVAMRGKAAAPTNADAANDPNVRRASAAGARNP